ncbi:hypothetical protein Q5752_001032 [Cryptotrichosporon argae]
MPVTAALLGSGIFATTAYLPALTGVPDLVISHLWSRSASSVSKLHAASTSLSNHADIATASGDDGLAAILADKDVEAVIVVLPIVAQPDVVRQALRAGKHVISEKPLGKDVAHAKALIDEYETVYKPKGLIWRVAENWAHEPGLRRAAELLRQPAVGPVLYYEARQEAVVPDGSKYHATSWRTIPEYQGGFVLDGGVHLAALVRVVLPTPPAAVLSASALHRTHLPPHDTVTALLLAPAAAATAPHGPPSAAAPVNPAELRLGHSAPNGTFLLSFAAPDVDAPGLRPPNGIYVATAHATLRVEQVGRAFRVRLVGAPGAGVENVDETHDMTGVQVELAQFADAVGAAKGQGAGAGADKGWSEPRHALWDLALIQATLTSEGNKVDLGALIG